MISDTSTHSDKHSHAFDFEPAKSYDIAAESAVDQAHQAIANAWQRELLTSQSQGGQDALARLRQKYTQPANFEQAVEAEVARRTQALEQKAYFDALTHLPNRSYLLEQLNIYVAQKQAQPHPQADSALVFMDLDRFKQVNDTLGHHIGDALLRHVSARMHARLASGEFLARLGGDEFVLWVPKAQNAHVLTRKLEALAQALEWPFMIEGHTIEISVSMGATWVSGDPAPVCELIDQADQAMYQIKHQASDQASHQVNHQTKDPDPLKRPPMDQTGTNTLAFYQPGQGRSVSGIKPYQKQARLSQVIRQGQLQLMAQAQVDLKQPKTAMHDFAGVSVELAWPDALQSEGIDWKAELARNPDTPGLAHWLFDSAVYYLKRWQTHCPGCSVSLPWLGHLSAVDMRVVMGEHGVSPEQIQWVCDGLQLKQRSEVDELNALAAEGFHLTLSQVGASDLDLNLWPQVDWSELRLDQEWLACQLNDLAGTRWVRGLIEMAHVMDLCVVATGVTTSARAQRLEKLGCDLAQGPFWGQAHKISEFPIDAYV